MSNLFKKAAILTDIHFGLKSNSQLHNEDCLNFVKWFITKAKENISEKLVELDDDDVIEALEFFNIEE